MIEWRKEGSLFVASCDCGSPIKCKSYYLSKHSGKCRSCSHKKPPFFHLFTKLINTAKHEGHDVGLTFEQFLEFTQQTDCHYCDENLTWEPYCYKDGKYKTGSYFLDRKNNAQGYSVENCVPCCTRCNRGKGAAFSYEEWKEMTSCLKSKR